MNVAIVAGGRDFTDYHHLSEVMRHLFWEGDPGMDGWVSNLVIVQGGAGGADTLAKRWSSNNRIPCREFLAKWDEQGKGAGHIRNDEMAKVGDMLVAFWDGKSPGTKSMIEKAMKRGLEVHVYRY